MNDMSPQQSPQSQFLISTRERRVRAHWARKFHHLLSVYVHIYQQFHEWDDAKAADMFNMSIDDLYRLCVYEVPRTRAEMDRVMRLMGHTHTSSALLFLFLVRFLDDTTRHDLFALHRI